MGIGGDPSFASVTLLAHMDGVNGATAFIDSSSLALNMAASQVQTNTAAAKFGPTGGRPTTVNGTIAITSSIAAFTFPGDFTVEGWAEVTSGDTDIFSSGDSGLTAFTIYYSGGNIVFTTSAASFFTQAFSLSTSYHFFAWSRNGSANRVYADGSLIGSFTNSTSWLPTGNAHLFANNSGGGVGTTTTGTNLDEWRVTNGVGRYPSTCSVPTAPFPDGVGIPPYTPMKPYLRR